MQVRLYHRCGVQRGAFVGGLFFRHHLVVEPSISAFAYMAWLLIVHSYVEFPAINPVFLGLLFLYSTQHEKTSYSDQNLRMWL